MAVSWNWKLFSDLSVDELHDLLALRNQVFVVEQGCIYQDLDLKDKPSFHVIGTGSNNSIIATARVLPPGVSYSEVSIGRVCLESTQRGKGIGKTLMEKCLECVHEEFGKVSVRISAQLYLQRYYEYFGFERVGEVYLEEDLDHIQMVLM